MKLKNRSFQMPRLHIRMTVEKDGIILSDRRQIGHSWVRNAWNLFHGAQLDCNYFGTVGPGESPFSPGKLAFRDTLSNYYSSTSYSAYPLMQRSLNYAGYGFYNASANANFGILVGTGDTAFSVEDYKLDEIVPHGNVAGSIYYQAQVAPVVSYDGHPDHTFTATISRKFNNNSGSSITIAEVGLAYYLYGMAINILCSRDVVDVPTEVVNGAQLTVSIDITTQSFATVEDGYERPAVGTLGSGGIYIGQFLFNSGGAEGSSDEADCLILAPVSGGQSAALAWSDPANAALSSVCNKYYYGAANSASLATASNCPIGAFIAGANAATLGGFTDWYVPGLYEMDLLNDVKGSIPAGEECDDAAYWTSTGVGSSAAYTVNPQTGAQSSANQTIATLKTRLVRRIHWADFVPD